MSELRELEIPMDIDLLESVAKGMGYRTERNARIGGYSTNNLTGELVIHTTHEDIGVHEGKLKYDNWHGSCDKALKEIMPKYMDKYVTRKLGRNIVSKSENDTQVIYVVQ